jgi:pilus assembly protein CpaE
MTSTPVIAVVSPKGGNGKTTVSANLAVAMARWSAPIIVDLDVHFGDVEFAFRLDPLFRLDRAVHLVLESPDADLEHCLSTHPTGVQALCAPDDPVEADLLDPLAVMAVVDHLLTLGRPVLLDTAGGISEYTLGALDRATAGVIVSGTDVPSVQAARKLLSTMRRMHMDLSGVHLVVNRSTARCGLSVADVENALGIRASLCVPEHQALTAGMNQGCPVTESDPGSPISLAFEDLAARLLCVDVNAAARIGLLRRFRR